MTPSRAYLDLIAERLAQSVSRLVPPDYDVRASRGDVGVVPRSSGPRLGGWPFTDIVMENVGLNPGESTEEVIARVTELLLDSIQQDITMDLKVPWPPVAGKPLGYFAAPMAKVEGDTFHLWFEVDGLALLKAEVDLSDTE